MAERNNLTAPLREPSSSSGGSTERASERSADEIRHDIAARRESITDAVDRLSDRFQRTLDWRAYVSNHPLMALGIAAGLGFLTARMVAPRQTPGERIKDALADSFEDLAGRVHHQLDGLGPRHSSLGLGGTVKAAATGLITKAVTDYLRDRFIGAHEQYPEYMRDYTGEYPAGDPEPEEWPGVRKKDSEPRH